MNPIVLVLIGVGFTLFAISVALCVAWAVLRKSRSNEKIVVVDNFSGQQQNNFQGTMAVDQSDRRFSGVGYPVLQGMEPV